jgi:hypothetical protein
MPSQFDGGTSMISNFEKALNRNEFPEYFRGTGIYFTKDPDWGTQLHVINWQGLCGYLKMQSNPDTLLKDAFKKYVMTIANTIEDASSLLDNIGCYYYMRKKIPALSVNGFDLIRDLPSQEKQIITTAMQFLSQEINKFSNKQDIDNYNLSITKLVKYGDPEDIKTHK